MIELQGEIVSLQEDFMSDTGTVTIKVPKHHLQFLSELVEKLLDIKISKHREKRSLNANAYCWKLCTEIANVLTKAGSVVTKDDIYRQALFSYGQSDIVTLRSDVDPARHFDYFIEKGKGTINEKEYTHYLAAVGSHLYNTEEMSILIDGIVAEAEALGISTMTPNELEQMKGRWGVEL